MKEKIKAIFDKINILIETQYEDKIYLYHKFRDADKPQRINKDLFELFPCGIPEIIDISYLENIIEKSKLEAAKYNKSELVIGGFYSSKSIILYYYETEREVFKRLSTEYNNMLKYIKNKKETEYKKYQELKLKYDNKR